MAALPEDLSSAPSTSTVTQKHLEFQLQGMGSHLWAS